MTRTPPLDACRPLAFWTFCAVVRFAADHRPVRHAVRDVVLEAIQSRPVRQRLVEVRHIPAGAVRVEIRYAAAQTRGAVRVVRPT